MKITKSKLNQIIKEETINLLREGGWPGIPVGDSLSRGPSGALRRDPEPEFAPDKPRVEEGSPLYKMNNFYIYKERHEIKAAMDELLQGERLQGDDRKLYYLLEEFYNLGTYKGMSGDPVVWPINSWVGMDMEEDPDRQW
tara:strand:+ start:325 stop:744 length:420 start_codon:yes stop_codon:yes gene_type:complete